MVSVHPDGQCGQFWQPTARADVCYRRGAEGGSMPSHLVVEVHGNTSEVVELDENDAILIGRDPDLHRLPPADRAARTKTFIQPSVSANHLLARRAGGAIELLDTDSRNGTWLRLPPGDCVQ